MEQTFLLKIAGELGLSVKQVAATIAMLDEGSTIPFIARYRKELTGGIDEVAITNIRDRIGQLRDLQKRREAILKSIEEQGKLSPELQEKIENAETMTALEDIYLPYKPKRKTKASVAREKGLEPLAESIMLQTSSDPEELALSFIDEEKGVANIDEALQGARDIMAENINENAELRSEMRKLFLEEGVISSKLIKGKEEEGAKYKDYFEWQEPVKNVPSHRLLAMRRGEKELILSIDIAPDENAAISLMDARFVNAENKCAEQVKLSVRDAYKRLLKPSMETEIRLMTKKEADEEAIRVFKENLRQLLLSAPMGQKNVMAIDPGFRTGCKLVCLNREGKLLHNEAIFPNEPQRRIAESRISILNLVDRFNIEAIAIGNGTASRETESFVRSIGLPANVQIVMVNESGASVYSASDVAREEFPDYDITVRGAVSIGRRLMDPLAELVKIDPKSIGVGQYQHDVDQSQLKQGLDDTVISCVNAVGVELNTASKEILSYVSGLGPSLAKNIVEFRNQNGPFKSRAALKKVPRLGDKAFEQAAGFLRIRESEYPLDRSAVHPESYHIVEKMAGDLKASVSDLMTRSELRQLINLKEYIEGNIGLPTLEDILKELDKPGRDPRETFESFSFMDGVNHMEDLKAGMKLPGIVTNITNFGAFVDIGVHQDGLVHLSHLADRFVQNVADVVKVQQKVMVTVLEVDIPRKRISLSMKSDPFAAGGEKKPPKSQPETKSKKPYEKKAEKPVRGQDEKSTDHLSFEEKLSLLKGKFK
ncbi:MAG: RNA-binding transcriptional accessory protein [Cyclobacteriaceae bacterium]|nr:RNA-binding transcriptional accessory protein [Cyclobacteriaceae bacterium]